MIITRTPYRLSLFGGGSDYSQWYEQHGGKVLGAAINHYCWLVVREAPSFGKAFKVIYAKMEECESVDSIGHPAVRETLRDMGHTDRLEIYHSSDLPARSGVGSSSAFVVGLVQAIVALDPIYWYRECGWVKADIAEEAIYIEQTILKETVGSQDQILCTHGGINMIEFSKDGKVILTPVFDNEEDRKRCAKILEERLLLFYTGVQRTASDVASGYVEQLSSKYEAVMRGVVDLVDKGVEVLKGIAKGDNPDRLGNLLDDSWHLKKQLPGVTNRAIDDLYLRAWDAGAMGGKVMGAGGGGFLLLYVPLEKQAAVRQALEELIEVSYKFDYDGVSVVYDGSK